MRRAALADGPLVALLCLWSLSPALGQDNPVAQAQVHQQQGMEAYQAGDYEGFARAMERALELNPASFATQYNLACGLARTGRPDGALDLLEGLTRARVDFGMARDPDLESLRDLPRFRELVALLEATVVPISNSEHRLTIDRIDLIPEGIAADRDTGRLFFGSMRTGEIFVVDASDQLSMFATLGHDGRRSAIGLAVDDEKNLLWVIGTHFFMAEGFDAGNEVAAGVFGFDLDTGSPKAQYLSADGGGLNDVAVAPSGDVYVSGSLLQVLRVGAEALEPVKTTPELFGSNGITLDPKETTLFVSAYPVGIAAIDLASGRMRYLESPADTALYGIDGLYWHEGDLVGIQNGIQPWRLLRMSLNAEATAIDEVRVIEFANSAISPTTGAIVDDEIHFIGRGAAPAEPPSHFDAALVPFLGKTMIMTAPLD